ncbi:DotU family type IV/VI secretion system protein [Paraburkholderia sp. UYCP14C]|uniref:DotU family type IV/VI secretion system protein n=1 Tax=Paraburkholderia sp. UYCP14C TaxID=2511130 RepID=UPI001020836E|nr:DotU family type IV/VI secretion system protein [Paraburkholderia sp. UYCP14C]RZF24055.1 DotU family type IV/VI secretion system protein [Paraburkholderia sp. UYCP14C]
MTLADTFIPLFAQLRAFAIAPSGDALSLSSLLDGAIAAARLRARDAGFSATDVDEALFAFNAWADELLLTTRWQGAAQWQCYLLQRRYSSVNNAGVVFFERLAQLTPTQLPVREVFYLCLALGFGGRYAYDRNQKTLDEIKAATLATLLSDADEIGNSASAHVFPDSYQVAGHEPAGRTPSAHTRFVARLSRGKLMVLLLPIVLLMLLCGAYHTVVARSVDELLVQIR